MISPKLDGDRKFGKKLCASISVPCVVDGKDLILRLCLKGNRSNSFPRNLPSLIFLHVILVKCEIAIVGVRRIESEVSQRAHVFRDHLGLDITACKAET